jgi:FG-GAP-like repeat
MRVVKGHGLVLCVLVATSGCRQVLGLDDLDCRPTYSAEVLYPVTATPVALVVADINVDGFADVTTANTMGNNVSRLLSNRDGTLATKNDHGAIPSPIDIASGDVTSDGVTDLVVLSSMNSFMVMAGDGSAVGGLTPEPGYPVTTPRDLEIADFNGDGAGDVVVASDADAAGHSLVQLAQSDGLLGAAADYGGPAGASIVRVADFTGDRVLDLLVAERTGTRPLVVLPGTGDGTFGTRIDSDNPVTILTLIVGDVNNDTVADLVIGSNDPAAITLTILLGTGDGTFVAGTPLAQTMPLFPHALVDLDADGTLDLVGEINGVGVALLHGAGDGTFAEPTVLPTSADPKYVAAANIDTDEVNELIVLLDTVNSVAILDGSCSYAPE